MAVQAPDILRTAGFWGPTHQGLGPGRLIRNEEAEPGRPLWTALSSLPAFDQPGGRQYLPSPALRLCALHEQKPCGSESPQK